MRVCEAATCEGTLLSLSSCLGVVVVALSPLALGMTSSMPTLTVEEVTPGLARRRSARSMP